MCAFIGHFTGLNFTTNLQVVFMRLTLTVYDSLIKKNGGILIAMKMMKSNAAKISRKKEKTVKQALKEIKRSEFAGLTMLLVLSSVILILLYGYIQNFSSHRMVIMQQIDEIKYYNVIVQNANYKMMMAKDGALKNTYRKEINQDDTLLQSELTDLKKLYPKSQESIDNVQKILQEALEFRSQAVRYADTLRTEDALLIIRNDYTPRMEKIDKELSSLEDKAQAEAKASLKSIETSIIIFEGFCILAVLILGFAMTKRIKKTISYITEPLDKIASAMDDMAKGNLDFQLDYHSSNEFGILADKLRFTGGRLKSYVEDVAMVLTQVADKNFVVEIGADYQGMFAPIRNSMENIIDSVERVVYYVKDSSEDVLSDSRELNQIAAKLSESSYQQKSILQEFYERMETVSTGADQNMHVAEEMKHLTDASGKIVGKGNEYIGNLEGMLLEVQDTFGKISDILTLVQDIADQIKLLTLNASIEAARAGEHGLGFAVLATQMRELVERTSDAAGKTEELIRGSHEVMHEGRNIVSYVQNNFKEVTEIGEKITQNTQSLWDLSLHQKQTMEQVKTQVEQVVDMAAGYHEVASQILGNGKQLNVQVLNLTSEMEKFRIHSKA
jgi:methyl-accepting chemotaxis protein